MTDMPEQAADRLGEYRPPLPPRPSALDVLQKSGSTQAVLPQRPKLISKATTALSSTVIESQNKHVESVGEIGLRDSLSLGHFAPKDGSSVNKRGSNHHISIGSSADASSIRSFAPTTPGIDAESLLDEVLNLDQRNPTWKPGVNIASGRASTKHANETGDFLIDIESEFHDVEGPEDMPLNEEQQLIEWKSKRKHFLILSQSGKPIWQRHGSDNLISGYIGAIQTIISFYESTNDDLRTFTAGDARFVILSRVPLYLVAISKIGESELQLRTQLDALYMQILSTLTLPTLSRLFSLRPSTDLRRPLRGTENLLSALADSFTRGSPLTLLASLECLKLESQERQAINDVMLKHKDSQLLYGLIVAGGKLVSVVRPKTHSLHPGDLQLIFNMLFEADGIQAGGGESWVPICLPGFNNSGFLYMYVSYLDEELPQSESAFTKGNARSHSPTVRSLSRMERSECVKEEERIAVLLISGRKDAFFELQACRNAVVKALQSAALLQIIRQSLRDGRSRMEEIAPGCHLRHFIYKSRGNLQLVMPAWGSEEQTNIQRRQLMMIYESLHTNLHRKGAQLKVYYSLSKSFPGIASMTDSSEIYCIGEAGTSKKVMAQALNKVIQWTKKAENKVFIIGGAVF